MNAGSSAWRGFLIFFSNDCQELFPKRFGRCNPDEYGGKEDHCDIRGTGRYRREKDEEPLVDDRSSRFPKAGADAVDGSLAFQLHIVLKRDVGHLFCHVEDGVFGGFAQAVLSAAEKYGNRKRGRAKHGNDGRCKLVFEKIEREKSGAGDEHDDRGD